MKVYGCKYKVLREDATKIKSIIIIKTLAVYLYDEILLKVLNNKSKQRYT